MRRVITALAVAALAAGCGGGGAEKPRADAAPAPAPVEPGLEGPAEEAPGGPLPRTIPEDRPGAAVEEAAPVIRAWLKAVREGDMRRASGFFAIPARVQNGGPAEDLRSRAQVAAWNAALPCGAILTDLRRGAHAFVVAEFRLTERRGGGDCAGGAGNTADAAIRVDGGKILEWYRLPIEPPERPERIPVPPQEPPEPTKPPESTRLT